MMFRSGKKFSREVSIYDPIGADKDGETVSLLDVLEAEDREVLETVIIKQDVKILYEAYKENLTEMEQTVIRMRYGLFGTKEHTQREIAEYYGFKDKYVVKGLLRRERRRNAEGIPKQRGRKPAKTLAEYKYENKRLKMENELLRDFLQSTERK